MHTEGSGLKPSHPKSYTLLGNVFHTVCRIDINDATILCNILFFLSVKVFIWHLWFLKKHLTSTAFSFHKRLFKVKTNSSNYWTFLYMKKIWFLVLWNVLWLIQNGYFMSLLWKPAVISQSSYCVGLSLTHMDVLERQKNVWLHRLLNRGQIDPHWFLCNLPEINPFKNSKEPGN